ncbi:MAG TPA: SDR family oxidoreductase [Gaiellales bacterium]|nr:SDR family oxidoreductase [Gaiellales bacterium]
MPSEPGSRRLEGRVAFVTGAAQGIGAAIATRYAAEGARVVVADQNFEGARQVAGQLAAGGLDASPVQVDVREREAVDAAIGAVIEDNGQIDVLTHNVGIYPPAPIERMSDGLWDMVLDSNLKSLFLAVRACIPPMRSQRGGRITVTSSITGPRVALAGLAHYAASKAGINGFIRSAALELAPFGITVNGVEPGSVRTEGVLGIVSEQELASQGEAIPLRRLATGDDIAAAHLFLCSEDASYITGQTIVVDGGQILPENLRGRR